jgi:release factor glutamine methyltransferase
LKASDWLAKGIAHLESRRVPEARANAEFLLAHVLKTTRGGLALESGRVLTERQGQTFWNLAHERGRRVPLAYILGTQPFCGLELEVGPQALIPRPETEEVVQEAVRLLAPRKGESLNVVEIGTGTGCIAVALAAALPNAVIYATEISPAALQLAERNALAHHKIRQIRFVREDLFREGHAPKGWADLVISNPPYIPSAEVDKLEPEVLKEPRLALDGGPDGLAAVRALIAQAPAFLKPGGWLVLEIGHDQGPSVLKLFAAQGLFDGVVRKDLQGHDRIAVARKLAP